MVYGQLEDHARLDALKNVAAAIDLHPLSVSIDRLCIFLFKTFQGELFSSVN